MIFANFLFRFITYLCKKVNYISANLQMSIIFRTFVGLSANSTRFGRGIVNYHKYGIELYRLR